VIARIVDGSRIRRVQGALRQTLVTGFAHIHGYPVGIVANNGILFRERAEGRAFHRAVQPAQHSAGVPAEHHRLHGRSQVRNGGIAKDGAKMVTAVACSHVPKFTVVIGGSFGAGNYGMCGRAYSPRFLWMWPNARISVMGGEQAASVLATVKRDGIEAKGKSWSAEEEAAFKAPIREQYERRAIPTTPPRACGTTASSTPPTPAACLAWPSRPGLNAPDRQPRRNRLPRDPHLPPARHPHRGGVFRRRCR
jgi:3-methylcrotonyl-CoA carboxylase beta subunit